MELGPTTWEQHNTVPDVNTGSKHLHRRNQEVRQDLLRGKSESLAREGNSLGMPPGESTQVLGHSWRREEIVLGHPPNFHPKGILLISKVRSLKAMGKAERRLPLQPAYSLACHKRRSLECVFRLHSAFLCCLHDRDGPEPAVHVTVSLPNLCGRAYQKPFQSMLGFVLFLSYCAIYEGWMSILHAHPQCINFLPRSSEPSEIGRHSNISKITSSLVGNKG